MPNVTIRPATPQDAGFLAHIINIAGHGLPAHFWQAEAGPGGDPLAVGRARAERDAGGFSWVNGLVAEVAGKAQGGLICYPLGPEPEPVAQDTDPLIGALTELENLALGTCYVNAVAVLDGARGEGLGQALLQAAETRRGPRGMSLISTDDNTRARQLYARHGYAEYARRPLIAGTWETESREWVLMVKL